MSDDKIKDKLRALLAKAEGTDNEFEAETFMAKVNELLEKHQIEMHELKVDDDPMGITRGDQKLSKSQSWTKGLVIWIARLYGADVVYWTSGNAIRYEIVGRESVRVTTELMLPFVLTQVRREGRKLAKKYGESDAVHMREVAYALTIRLQRMCVAARKHRDEMIGKGLIPVSDIDALKAEKYPQLKTKDHKVGNYGLDAAKSAQSINVQVQATGRKDGIKLLT